MPETHPVSPSLLGFTPEHYVICLDSAHPLASFFQESDVRGLFALSNAPREQQLDLSLRYWRTFTDVFLRTLRHLPDDAPFPSKLPLPAPEILSGFLTNIPPMQGAEYLSKESLQNVWQRLLDFPHTLHTHPHPPSDILTFFEKFAPAWQQVGRITLHLAENPAIPERPFAFMATYTKDLSTSGRLNHIPLQKALDNFNKTKNNLALQRLLTPLHTAAENSPFLHQLFSSNAIFQVLSWTPDEAYQFLSQIPVFENAGLATQIPNWWKKRATRPMVQATLDAAPASAFNFHSLFHLQLSVTLQGRVLSPEEMESLLQGTDGLVLFKHEWIEIDRAKLKQALQYFRYFQNQEKIPLLQALRLLAGIKLPASSTPTPPDTEWSTTLPGSHLKNCLQELVSPPSLPPPNTLPRDVKLRPYQLDGLNWLWSRLQKQLGACLADDMGLGKTIQVLACLLRLKEFQQKNANSSHAPNLIVLPASLLGNWQQEIRNFAPALKYTVLHPSSSSFSSLFKKTNSASADLASYDLIITTYGMLPRLPTLQNTPWNWIILDEAQTIKNPHTKISQTIFQLSGSARLALTGTPIENNLFDLWSLFHFLNPELLGPLASFKSFLQTQNASPSPDFASLRRLISPFLLRRLKTDRSIISDLPPKTEMKVYCGLSPVQARLYKATLQSLAQELNHTSKENRSALLLVYLSRFKQICNHPDQLTKTGNFLPKHSAKFLRLIEICQEISARGEKALIFTAYKELTSPLEATLAPVFQHHGLILHGSTPTTQRQQLVEHFQNPQGNSPPFFILSLKAGGTGLNLTAATHVIHFDRWWNPAIENQATDRAFRIGQSRPVLVHKFVTTGTLEEKIDSLLTQKFSTAQNILAPIDSALPDFHSMSNKDLLDFFQLQSHASSHDLE